MDVHEAPEIVPFEEGLDIVDTIGQMGDINSRESIDFARLARDESSPIRHAQSWITYVTANGKELRHLLIVVQSI